MKINSIYIIDDDVITVFGLKKILNKQNAELHLKEFRNGKKAIEGIAALLESGTPLPEVIFLDINMPIMDGWAFLDEFSQIPNAKKVHIKMITSSIDIRDREKWQAYVKKTGLHIDFLIKPIYQLSLDDIASSMDMAS